MLWQPTPDAHLPMFSFISFSRRLALSCNEQGVRSVASKLATIVVAVSIFVVLLTFSITKGFTREIYDSVGNVSGQIMVMPSFADEGGVIGREDLDAVLESVTRISPEARISVERNFAGLLKSSDEFEAVEFRCLSDCTDVSFIKEILGGSSNGIADSLMLTDTDDFIVISRHTAELMQLTPGDRVNLIYFDGENPRTRNPRLAATYESGVGTIDTFTGFASRQLANSLLGEDNGVASTVRITGIPHKKIELTASQLREDIENKYYNVAYAPQVMSMFDTSANFFNWLQLIESNITVIIVIMGLIAALSLIAALFVLIIEKTGFIGILKALGATNSQIRATFLISMGRTAVRGMVWGSLCAILFVYIQDTTHLLYLDPEAYFIDHVPVSLNLGTFFAVDAAALILSFAVMWLPSAYICRLAPASALRFE